METQVEEVAENRVRMRVEVPQADVQHAVEHAASDLAQSVKIPGFRKGKVPMPVLISRIGKERVYREAVDSHISGWFWNAAARNCVRPVEQVGQGLLGMSVGETKQIEFERADEQPVTVDVAVKEIKEKVLPPLDDNLARAASEFDTLAELRADIESRLREQLE